VEEGLECKGKTNTIFARDPTYIIPDNLNLFLIKVDIENPLNAKSHLHTSISEILIFLRLTNWTWPFLCASLKTTTMLIERTEVLLHSSESVVVIFVIEFVLTYQSCKRVKTKKLHSIINPTAPLSDNYNWVIEQKFELKKQLHLSLQTKKVGGSFFISNWINSTVL
jgi:hypothetical protein